VDSPDRLKVGAAAIPALDFRQSKVHSHDFLRAPAKTVRLTTLPAALGRVAAPGSSVDCPAIVR
jgi:hypothetical protein